MRGLGRVLFIRLFGLHEVRIFLIGLSFLLLGQTATAASIINLRGNTGFDTWRQPVDNLNSSRITRGYQSFRFSLYDSKVPKFSLNSFIRLSSNLESRGGRNPWTRIYHLYAGYHNAEGLGDVFLGRQFILEGVAIGAIDGLRYKNSLGTWGKINLFAGASAPVFKSLRIGSPRDGYMVGGSIFLSGIPKTELKLSYNRKADRHYLREINGTLRELPAINQQLVGIDGRFTPYSFLTQYLYLVWDIPGLANKSTPGLKSQLTRFEWSTSIYSDSKYSLTMEHYYRNPQVPYYSFFINFRELFEANRETGIRFDYWLTRDLRVDFYSAYVDYAGSSTMRFRAGVLWHSLYGGYAFRNGQGGERDGLMLSGTRRLGNRVLLHFGMDYTKVRIIESAPLENSLSSLSAGLKIYVSKRFGVDIEAQHLSQDINNENYFGNISFGGYDNDFRFLGKINYWFSTSRLE